MNKMNESINGTKYHDILFIGSSRTYYHVNPRIIDSIANVSSFNAGTDGAGLLEMNMMLQCYLKTHPAPKKLVLELSWQAFSIDGWGPIFNPNTYYPFLDNEIIYRTLKPYKPVFLLKYFPFFQLTQLDDFMREGAIVGYLGKKRHTAPIYKGYLQNTTDTLTMPFIRKYGNKNFRVTEKGKGYFNEIINMCRDKKIQLLVMYPPVYKCQDNDMAPDFFSTIEHTCRVNNLIFLNFRSLSLGNNHRLFRDEMHLNKIGANHFSQILAQAISKL
jgi:hypothetical protein